MFWLKANWPFQKLFASIWDYNITTICFLEFIVPLSYYSVESVFSIIKGSILIVEKIFHRFSIVMEFNTKYILKHNMS